MASASVVRVTGGGSDGVWFGVLGPVLVRTGDGVVVVGSGRQRVLLAALLMRAGQVVPVDELAEAVWDGTPPRSARPTLINYVKRLRQVLGPVAGGRIVTRFPGYLAEAGEDELDLLAFDRLCARGRAAARAGAWPRAAGLFAGALGLWRAVPLIDVPSGVLAREHAFRLEQARLATLDARIDADLRLGRHAEVIPELQALAAAHPLRERFHALLMLALYRDGRQGEALAAYRTARQLLVTELGIEPGPQLRTLHQHILTNHPHLFLSPPTPDPVSELAHHPTAVPHPAGTAAALACREVKEAGAFSMGLITDGEWFSSTDSVGRARYWLPDPAIHAEGVQTTHMARSAARERDPPGRKRADWTGQPIEGGAGSGPVVPRQLPAAVRHFTGRALSLERLGALLEESALNPQTVVIAAISGTAGVGKTALAVNFAHQAAARFPDGQLYVNLRGFGPAGTPAAPQEVIRGFLGAFQVPAERVPADLDAQAALYRSALAGKRVLILLDNAREIDQVRPLLPGTSGCLVIITSRNKLTGLVATDCAELLSLDVLTDDEAHDLLASRLGPERVDAEPAAVGELIRLCARLPLALAITAAHAAIHPARRLADLAAELRVARCRLDAFDTGEPRSDARAAFSWSCLNLTGPAARTFQLLGLHPGPDITVDAAASLAGLPLSQIQGILNELTVAHLIAEHASRYAMHDLLRVYAAEQAGIRCDEAERQAAVRRMLDYYLHTTYRAERLLDPLRDPITLSQFAPDVTVGHPANYEEALAWFEAEHRVLLGIMPLAAGAGFYMHAWQLAWALTTYLYRYAHWHDWAAVQRVALDSAIEGNDQEGQAHAQNALGRAYQRLGAHYDARAHLHHALALFAHLSDYAGQARCHIDLGCIFSAEDSYDLALNHASRALSLADAAGSPVMKAGALNNMGLYLGRRGENAQALSYCQQALSAFRELADYAGEARALESVGYVHHQLGQHHQAITCYELAVERFREIGSQFEYDKAVLLSHLAEARRVTGDVASACEAWQGALAILDRLHHPDAAGIRIRLGEV